MPETVEMLPTTETPASNGNSPKTRPKHPTSYVQAIALQKLAVKRAEDESNRASDTAQLIRAWEALERLKRDIKGKPNPSRVKPPTKPTKRNAAQATFEE